MTRAGRPHDSLLEALTAVRIPVENHEFIRRIVNAIGIVEFRAVPQPGKGYIRAIRRDGLPDLHIYFGYTTGFTSEDEVNRAAANGAGRGRSSSQKGTWYVEHPTNRMYRGREDSVRDVRREAGFCRCGMQLSLTGICPSCD
ncbi:hypothetical protein GCM10009632_39240 [Mycolicibacterium alvei]|uniref:Uncharacterized protein n=1 Tax=Mycolicibacterium alvei TaxID=67081 RepID=A0A6N4UUS3_9MYCO|nr:hypothetical protein MALV_25520 [Mycolicibacterium alvei]